MITVDVNNAAELYDAGLQVLSDNLGTDAAQAFLCLPFRGRGDFTAEKKYRPKWNDADYDAHMAEIIEDAKMRGEA
jgi:hypothetical protein